MQGWVFTFLSAKPLSATQDVKTAIKPAKKWVPTDTNFNGASRFLTAV